MFNRRGKRRTDSVQHVHASPVRIIPRGKNGHFSALVECVAAMHAATRAAFPAGAANGVHRVVIWLAKASSNLVSHKAVKGTQSRNNMTMMLLHAKRSSVVFNSKTLLLLQNTLNRSQIGTYPTSSEQDTHLYNGTLRLKIYYNVCLELTRKNNFVAHFLFWEKEN